jgi:two-component system chemotaxis response regulator CheY
MRLKCLIAEDAQFIREIYRYALMNSEFVEIVAEATDGEEAMKLLAEVKPDVMLLDLVLPVKSGLDILKEVSMVAPKTKVIVISSIDDEKIIGRAKALGAFSYIKKPFTKSELLKACEEAAKVYSEVENG